MRGLVFHAFEQMEFREFPDPVPGLGEVVVDMKAASLCGSDLHALHAHEWDRDMIMGHEGAGVISAVGPDVPPERLGERVTLYHIFGCGHCRNCYAGFPLYCEQKSKFLAGPLHGTNADKVLMPARYCLRLPDDISFEVGAFLGCFAGTSFSAMEKLAPSGLHTVAVFGLGPVGLAGVQFAAAMGADVIGIDHNPVRLALAKELGAMQVIDFTKEDVINALRAATDGCGPECLYETSGSPQAVAQAIEACAVRGKIVMVGHNGPKSFKGGAQPFVPGIIGKEATLMGSAVMSVQHHFDIIRFIRKKKIDLEKMTTHRFPFEDIEKAIRVFDTGDTGKVVITF